MKKKNLFTSNKIKISGNKVKNSAKKTQKLTNIFNGIHNKRPVSDMIIICTVIAHEGTWVRVIFMIMPTARSVS